MLRGENRDARHSVEGDEGKGDFFLNHCSIIY